MTPRSWIRNLFAPRTTRTVRQVPARRLALEAFEDRALLTVGFTPALNFAAGYQPDSVAVGDFNGDGRPDLVTNSPTDDNVSVLAGNGNGTFQTAVTYGVGDGPNQVVAGDFNADGRQDLATADRGGTVSVLAGNGDGTFQGAVHYAAGFIPQGVVAGDFNGDGRQDLAVANRGSNVSVLMGNGDGTFRTAVNYAAGTYAESVAVGDFNGDGRQDLVTANPGSGDVTVLAGNGDGTFQAPVAYLAGYQPRSVAVGDFDGDGRQDLAVANTGGSTGGTVSVLAGNGDGTFRPAVTYAAGRYSVSVMVGDLDGDGRQDLAAANLLSGDVTVLAGNGDGTFRTAGTYAAGTTAPFVAVGEFNGDGLSDLAVASGNNLGVLRGYIPITTHQAAVTTSEGSPVANTGTFRGAAAGSTVALTASVGTVTKNDAAGTWAWSYTPADNTAGPATVTITAADTAGGTTSTTFTLTADNVAPTITSFQVPAETVGARVVNLTATATDPAGASDPLTYAWTITSPDGTTVFNWGGPTPGFKTTVSGSYTVKLVVSDGDGGSTQRTSTLTVYSLAASEKFVRALYQRELGRPASPAEVNSWVVVLAGPGGRSAVVAGIANSTEARARLVSGWFQTYLGRTADAATVNGFAATLAGQSEEQMVSGILGSQEFFNRSQTLGFGGTPDQNYVRALYQSVLGRTASSAEVDGQVIALQQVGRPGLALAFLQSQEYRSNIVRGYYADLLHRPGSAAEIAAWASSNLDVRAIRLAFESSDEFFVNG